MAGAGAGAGGVFADQDEVKKMQPAKVTKRLFTRHFELTATGGMWYTRVYHKLCPTLPDTRYQIRIRGSRLYVQRRIVCLASDQKTTRCTYAKTI